MSEAFPTGSYPPMPGEPPRGPAVQGPPPPPVDTAVKLMFARAAVSVLGLLVLLVTRDSLTDVVRDANPSFDTTRVDDAVSTAITIGIVFGIIFIALYVLLALQVRKGRSWARIVTLVLAVLSVLSGVVSLLGTSPALSRVVGLITVVIDAAIIFFLTRPQASQYFRRTP